ncbi:MAG TPA: hypothetical protein VEB19_15375 [Gemmatimonadaceae bacterium]|nr:hypothetical protein [Gemmatimonadaceae bacterium]
MSHLSIERLAALADESPTSIEHMHLESCAECAREVDAHRSLLVMAHGERDAMGLPLSRWESLSEKLRDDGLIATPGRSRSGGRGMAASNPYLRYAAALLLVAGGALLGRASAGASLMPGDGVRATASIPSLDSVPTDFASVEHARQFKDFYRLGYQRAVSYIAEQDTSMLAETPAVMRARLSALDRVSRITREALNDAPFDPVINDFYLNSYGQREATLRALNTALPPSVRLNSF